MNISNIKHLVLSGGGLLGISYIGLFKYLEEHNVNCQIQTITGCSAGAIFGAFLSVGYTGDELDKILKGLCFKDYLNITAESIINFMRLKGFESGKNLMSLIKKIIKDKTNDENITFSQIQARFNITLKIGVTNLTTSKFELLSYINMPNLPIHQAINASIAIPFIFEPVVINNNIYVDGGLLDNLPIEQILNFEANANATVNGLKENATVNGLKENANATGLKENENENENANKNETVNTELIDIEINTLCIYLMNKFTELTCDNYHSLPLSHYFNAIINSISMDI